MITRWRYFHSSVMVTRWRYCRSAAMVTRWRYCLNAAMVTRWQYYLSAAITRWHHWIGGEMVTAWVHWIVTVLQINFDCKKKEDKSLLDVENVETAVERCCNLTRRTPLNCSLCMFIGMNHISPKFSYIIPIYLMLTPFTKTLPKCHFTYFFCYKHREHK